MKFPFFQTGYELANLFTETKNCEFDFQLGGEPIEVWQKDICQNLRKWTIDGNVICYETENGYYVFQLEGTVIKMTKYQRGNWARLDSWINLHSCVVGKDFLKNHQDKKIDMFT